MSRQKRGLIRKSTREFYLEGKRTADYSLYDFMHGYLYSKWPYLYISVALGEHRLSKVLQPVFLFLKAILEPAHKGEPESPGFAWANSYHGKVVPIDEAQRLVSIQEDIFIKDLEQVIPFDRAKDIIMHNPQRIIALDCPCRMARENPCTPVDVCLIVGDPFASFILEHQPEKSRLISPEEAMDILKAEHDRGHVSHAFFKDAMLNRFYAICNCCSCCCGAFQAHQNGTPMLMTSGYTASVDSELCEGCETCSRFCQFEAIDIVDHQAQIRSEDCFGCGVCVDQCQQHAITLHRDPAKGIPLEIHKLMEQASLVMD
jgi:Pyruvate/2-oxoacid:ferredoxin oxidoreductase delta subunit